MNLSDAKLGVRKEPLARTVRTAYGNLIRFEPKRKTVVFNTTSEPHSCES